MLYFVGLGLEQSLSVKTLKDLEDCNHIYYESYTSPVVNENLLNELSERLGGKREVVVVKREFVEDGRKILDAAKDSNVALLCSGDPMVATTHEELRTRAIKLGIRTRIVHGSSVICSVTGESGLHSYNFGRVVTMTREPMQYTAYNTIFRNLLIGLHTIVLLEWSESTNFFLQPSSAIQSLLDAERDLRYGVLNDQSLLLVVSRLGTEKVAVRALSFQELKESTDLGEPPHVLVIPGRLHFTEREALGAIVGTSPESFVDNSTKIVRVSEIMVSKYADKTMRALERAKKAAQASSDVSGTKVKFADIFENVECYTRDAERFLNEGKEELAILSIGYAEGLLDSLRFGGQLEFEW